LQAGLARAAQQHRHAEIDVPVGIGNDRPSSHGHSGRRAMKPGDGRMPAKVDPRLPADCWHEGVANLRLLLAHGANVGLTDANGLTALHYAARTDYGLEIAEPLLSRGADVNARDGAGRTPLDHARELGLTRMPPLLERHGGKSSRDLG
jgi:hypothetical protein